MSGLIISLVTLTNLSKTFKAFLMNLLRNKPVVHISLVIDKAFVLLVFRWSFRLFSCSYFFFTCSSIGNARFAQRHITVVLKFNLRSSENTYVKLFFERQLILHLQWICLCDELNFHENLTF
jgi:hypothetical protein